MKCNNTHVIGIPEVEEREQGIEYEFEDIITENFPNQMKEKLTQVQEAQKISIEMNLKRPTPRHITIKMAKFKEKERKKAAREKTLATYNVAPRRL